MLCGALYLSSRHQKQSGAAWVCPCHSLFDGAGSVEGAAARREDQKIKLRSFDRFNLKRKRKKKLASHSGRESEKNRSCVGYSHFFNKAVVIRCFLNTSWLETEVVTYFVITAHLSGAVQHAANLRVLLC